MRDETEIQELLNGMYKHAKYIRDDFQRFGFDNFRSALEWVLNNNQIINAQITAAAQDLGLNVGYVRIGDKDVDISER